MAADLAPTVQAGSKQVLRVLLVDDDFEDCLLFERQLSKQPDFDVDFTWANDVHHARRLAREKKYDVIFVDYRLCPGSGMGLLSRLLDDDPAHAIVMVTGYGDENARTESLRRGAIDYLAKSELSPRALYRCLKRSLLPPNERASHEKRINKAMFDRVAGVYTLPAFLGAARQEIEACRGSDSLHALLVVDIDNYGGYVQRNGEKAGEAALEKVAQAIGNALPKCGMVGRYGKDKFCVLAQIEHRWMAQELTEHIRAGVERIADITVSVGVACVPAESAHINDLISSADAAKYNAQQEGRNRSHIIWRL